MRRYLRLSALLLAACGTAQVAAASPRIPTQNPALALWHAFPVNAKPRPIVPLGEGMVLDPASGFRSEADKVAYMEGHFVLRTPLPGPVGRFGRFTVVSATVAYHRLRATTSPHGVKAPPLIVTAVRLGTATFTTDRGRMRLPGWRFFFKGVIDPAFVLALGSPDPFVAPPVHRFGPPGPGNSVEDAAVASSDATAITLSFFGAPAGNAPCDASYTATAVADRRAVAFTIHTIAVPVPPGEACAAVGFRRTAILRLSKPLGARVLISATDGGAVPVITAHIKKPVRRRSDGQADAGWRSHRARSGTPDCGG